MHNPGESMSAKIQSGTENPKVLVLSQLFYPELVSTGQTITELCEVMQELGMDIQVISGPPTLIDRKTKVSRNMTYHGIRIKRVWGTRFPKLSFLGKLFNQLTYAISMFFTLLFDRSKTPILVLTNPPFLGIFCQLLPATRKRPLLYVVFDVYPDTAVNLNLLKANGPLARSWDWWNRRILSKANAVIVLGRCMFDIILKKGQHIKSLDQKTHIIHIWSDDRHIKPVEKTKNPYIEKWALQDKFVLGYSGNMGKFHDMETIMEAARLLQDNPDILFLFIGEGSKKQSSIDFVKKWKLPNCQFHPYVPRQDLIYSINCADVGLVSLMTGQEGLSVPSKTFGFMAAHKPIIAIMSQKSEIARIITEENCGMVVKPGSAEDLMESILQMFRSKEYTKELGENAQKAIFSKYNLLNAAQNYCKIISELNRLNIE